MVTKKYPIGTKIRFIWEVKDTNKIGVIVALDDGYPVIYLPKSTRHFTRVGGIKYSWICKWSEIELLVVKGQQLLFDFAYE